MCRSIVEVSVVIVIVGCGAVIISHKLLGKDRLQHALKFVGLNRFTYEAVEAFGEEHLLGRAHGVRGQCDDRNSCVKTGDICTDPLHRLDTVHAAHHVVHKDNIEYFLTADIYRLLP